MRITLTRPRPAPSTLPAPSARPWAVVGTVCVGAFMGQLDASIVALALPTLEQAFGTALNATEWVALSYLLVLAGLVVAFGRLADIVGRKLLYTVGFIVFIAGSALGGSADGLPFLVGARVLQGVGAAMLQANSVALITQVMDSRSLGRAIGVQGAAQALGLAVGPAVGGLLVATLGWRWIFLVNVPAGLVGVALALRLLPPDPPSRARQHFDLLGAAVFLPAIAACLYGLTYAPEWGWTSPGTVSTLAVGGVGLAAFLLIERRAREPMLDLGLFRRPAFSAGIAAGLLSYAVLFGALFVLPFLFERVQGRDPRAAGALLSAVAVGLGCAAPASGLWADRSGSQRPAVTGMLLAAGCLLGLVFDVQARVALPPLIALLLLFGIGLGLFTPANNSAIMASAPRHRLGVAGGILNMTRGLGTTAGVAVAGAVLGHYTGAVLGQSALATHTIPVLLLGQGIRASVLVLAGLAVVTAIIAGMRAPADRPAHPEEAAGAADARLL